MGAVRHHADNLASVTMQRPHSQQPILPFYLCVRHTLRPDREPITSNDCGIQLRFHHAADPSTFYFSFFLFNLNSLLHLCLNLFLSEAVEATVQVAAELNLIHLVPHPSICQLGKL